MNNMNNKIFKDYFIEQLNLLRSEKESIEKNLEELTE